MATHVQSEKVYVCGMDECLEQFGKWSLVVAHRKNAHPPTTSFPCEECEKVFNRKRNLQAHTRRVHAKLEDKIGQACSWEDCDKLFSSKSALKVHIATVHENKKPYTCEECGKCFGHKHLLVRHRRIHNQEPKIESSPEESKSPNIMELLTGDPQPLERQYVCHIKECRRVFMRQYDLDRHALSSHSSVIMENRSNYTE